MAFNELIRGSGKGLDVSKELVVAIEINLSGTVGTHYFADKNINIEGTYYDGRLKSVSTVNRSIFPDTGSFEISNLDVILSNHDNEFSKPKWLRWSQNSPVQLKIALQGTKSIQQSDFATRYLGVIEDISFDVDDHQLVLRIEDKSQKALKKLIPTRLIGDGDFDYLDKERIPLGTPLPHIYGEYFESPPAAGLSSYFSAIPGLTVGTYVNGTSRVFFANHAVNGTGDAYDDNSVINVGSYTFYMSGTISSYSDDPVAYMDLNYDIGTSLVTMQLSAKGTEVGELCMALLQEAGLEDSEIGTATFEEHQNYSYDPNFRINAHGFLNNQLSIKEWVDNLCYQTNTMMYFDSNGKAKFKRYRFHYGTSNPTKYIGTNIIGTRELTENDFLHFNFYKDASHVFNKLEMLYHYVPHYGVYHYYGLLDHKPSQTRLGYTREKKIEAYWLYGTRTHWRHWTRLNRFAYPIYKANFQLPIAALPLELGDVIQITHTQPPNEYGTQGWQQKPMEIVSIEEDYDNLTVDCETWGWPTIPSDRLKAYWSFAEGTGTLCQFEFCREDAGELQAFSNSVQNLIQLPNPDAFEGTIWANKIGNDYVATLPGDGTSFLSNVVGLQIQGDFDYITTYIKPKEFANDMSMVSCCKLGTNGWELGIKANASVGSTSLFFASGTGGNWVEKESPKLISAGTWQGVGCKIERISTTRYDINWYMNGTEIGTSVRSYVLYSNVTQPTAVGASNAGTWLDGTTITGCKQYNGQIGDTLFYDYWTAGNMPDDSPGPNIAEIERLHNALRGRYKL